MFRIFLIVGIYYLLTIQLKSQDTTVSVHDSIPINSIDFTSSKLVNTFLLNNQAILEYELFDGKLTLNQKYNGSTQKNSKTVKDSFNNDSSFTEIVNMDYEEYDIKLFFPIWDSMNFVVNQNLFLYSVTRDIGINKMDKFSVASGFRYIFNKESFLELNGGIERNYLLGISYLGKLLNIEGNLTEINIEDYNIQSSLKGNYIDLTKNRKNMNLDFKYNMFKKFDEFDIIDFELNYKLLYYDNLPPINISGSKFIEVETRNENQINSKIKFDFAVFNSFYGLFDISIQKIWIDKFYKQYYDSISNTGVTRNRNDLELSFLTEGKYKTSTFIQTAGIYFNIKTQDNNVLNTYHINDADYNHYKADEAMFDLDGNTTRFYLRTDWLPNQKETIKFEYSVSLYQHDTPSKDDNTDRDEFTSIINAVFIHKFDDALKFSIDGNLQFNHHVYIKSQMSANNYWERIISLKSKISWLTRYFIINPEFEIISKYTNYDFEEDSSLNLIGYSYSDRQIAYKDSINIKLGKLLSLQFNVNLRYIETGVFFWKSFSESPQSSRLENYIKAMLFTNFIDNVINIGCGIKYYSITQKSLINFGNNELTPGDYYVSLGPAVDLTINFSNGSNISLQGFYEFQNVNNFIFKEAPIFYLTTKIVL